MKRILLATLLALATTASSAQTFESHEIRLRETAPKILGWPIQLAGGDLVLTETDARDSGSWQLRFGDGGQWRRVMPRPGYAWSQLMPMATGDFIGVAHGYSGSTCELYALSPELQLKWRHQASFAFDSDNEGGGDCGTFAQDADGRTWYRDADFSVGYLHGDGSFGPDLDLRNWLDPSGAVQATALAAFPNHAGAVVAVADVVDRSRTELVALSEGNQITWRHPLSRLQGEGLEVSSLQIDATGEIFAIGTSHDASSIHLMALRLDANGTLRWMRRYPELPLFDFHASHRFADGSLGVLYRALRAGNTAGWEYRIALIGADGNMQRSLGAGSEFLDIVRLTRFVQLGNGSRWLISNRSHDNGGLGVAWDLDGDGALQPLGIGKQTGVALRSDGLALVFGDALGAQAMLFDGLGNAQRVAFDSMPPYTPNPSPLNRKPIGDGDDLLLWVNERLGQAILSRLDAQGHERWQRALGEGSAYAPGVQRDRLQVIDAQTACVRMDARLACIDTGTGVVRFERSLSTTTEFSALASSGAIELLFTDAEFHFQHWLLSTSNEVLMARDLGNVTPIHIEPGHVLALGAAGSNTLVESSTAAAAATTRVVPADSALLSAAVSHRFDNGDFLVATGSGMRLQRCDAQGLVLWARDLATHADWEVHEARLVHGSESVLVHSVHATSGHSRRLHFSDAASGQPLGVPARPGDGAVEPVFAVDEARSSVIAIDAHAGVVALRPFDFHGVALAPSAWRCQGDCAVREASAAAGQVRMLVEEDGEFAAPAMIQLTLSDAIRARRIPHPDDGAISGVFVAANDSNRGYLIDWLPSARVLFVARFAGDASDTTWRALLDWETMQGTVSAGASEITLSRYRNADGRFAAADDAPITRFGSATFRFDGCDAAELVLTDTSGAQPVTEVVHLLRSGPRVKTCALLDGTQIAAQATLPARGGFDTRQSGVWVAAGASDQGLLAAVLPATADGNGVFFAPWFTYWTDVGANPGTANRHWLTLQGTLTPASDHRAELTIYRATAGSHGPTRPSNTYRVGTATWPLQDCEHATLDYQFDPDESAQPYSGRSGTLNFSRPGACSGGP